MMNPIPNYVIIGTGNNNFLLSDECNKFLKDLDIKIDIVDTFIAASTFNFCSEDGVDIVAYIIPYD